MNISVNGKTFKKNDVLVAILTGIKCAEILANPSVSMLGYEYNGGEVVSCCTLCVIPNMSRGMKPYGLLENVVTHPKYRRKGFATTLLKTAQSIAWELGCYKIMLLTGSQQESTLLFYKKCGFLADRKQGLVVYPFVPE